MVNYIDRRIFSLVFDILFMLFIVVITYNVWGNINISKYATIASKYANNSESLKVVLEEDEGDLLLSISNSDSNIKEYVLSLSVKDSYNLDSDELVIKYLDNVINLDSFDNYRDNNSTYYILDNNIISEKETKEYSITLYNNVEFSFNIQEM